MMISEVDAKPEGRPEPRVIVDLVSGRGGPAGDALRVWDTPGLGDSARLLKRLELTTDRVAHFGLAGGPAKSDVAVAKALKLAPDSPIAHIERVVRRVTGVAA